MNAAVRDVRCSLLIVWNICFGRPDVAELVACTTTSAAASKTPTVASDTSFAQDLSSTVEGMWSADPMTRPDFHSLVKVFDALQKRWAAKGSDS